MEYHGYLDKFTIIERTVIAQGWGNHLDLKLWYDGVLLDLSIGPVPRPDLIVGFGEEAFHWGFTICAVLPIYEVDRRKFVLQFSSGLTVSDPTGRYGPPDDLKLDAMIEKFRNEVAVNKGRILEIGSRERSGNNYRHWFPDDIDYVGLDISPGPNVSVTGDAHHLNQYFDTKFDFMFSMATFEHLLMPWKVALEMNKSLTDNGLGLIVSHAAWPLHEEPWDFFRFSKDAWQGIFNLHTGFEIIEAQYKYPTYVIPHFATTDDCEKMSHGRSYLLSGCLIRKVGQAKVAWEADAGELYDLNYSHA